MLDFHQNETLDERSIEFAAQALREHVGNRSGRGRAWSDLPESLRESYRAEARTVIAAYLHARTTVAP
jgi:hypothetical protein